MVHVVHEDRVDLDHRSDPETEKRFKNLLPVGFKSPLKPTLSDEAENISTNNFIFVQQPLILL